MIRQASASLPCAVRTNYLDGIAAAQVDCKVEVLDGQAVSQSLVVPDAVEAQPHAARRHLHFHPLPQDSVQGDRKTIKAAEKIRPIILKTNIGSFACQQTQVCKCHSDAMKGKHRQDDLPQCVLSRLMIWFQESM
jgi:hypothetical protein